MSEAEDRAAKAARAAKRVSSLAGNRDEAERRSRNAAQEISGFQAFDAKRDFFRYSFTCFAGIPSSFRSKPTKAFHRFARSMAQRVSSPRETRAHSLTLLGQTRAGRQIERVTSYHLSVGLGKG
jgi:hypothetical protein